MRVLGARAGALPQKQWHLSTAIAAIEVSANYIGASTILATRNNIWITGKPNSNVPPADDLRDRGGEMFGRRPELICGRLVSL